MWSCGAERRCARDAEELGRVHPDKRVSGGAACPRLPIREGSLECCRAAEWPLPARHGTASPAPRVAGIEDPRSSAAAQEALPLSRVHSRGGHVRTGPRGAQDGCHAASRGAGRASSPVLVFRTSSSRASPPQPSLSSFRALAVPSGRSGRLRRRW